MKSMDDLPTFQSKSQNFSSSPAAEVDPEIMSSECSEAYTAQENVDVTLLYTAICIIVIIIFTGTIGK